MLQRQREQRQRRPSDLRHVECELAANRRKQIDLHTQNVEVITETVDALYQQATRTRCQSALRSVLERVEEIERRRDEHVSALAELRCAGAGGT